MFPFQPLQKSLSKAYVCNGSLPFYVNPEQPPTRKKPFDTINDQAFSHTVEMLISVEIYDKIWPYLESKIAHLEYSRVMMYPSELLDGDFFNEYIKRGNILMLSEGRPGIDDKYILKDGQMRLELPKDIYERTGLQGTPVRSKGRKHIKTRYAIEIDLRATSMLHGKKGFERIVWAFKNVLNHSITWLFYDFEKQIDSKQPRPIAKHHPFHHIITPRQEIRSEILTPPLQIASAAESEQDFEDWALETYEWLGLVSLASPRVQASDNIDPFLCRYRVPGHEDSSNEPRRPRTIVSLTWKGFTPSHWIRDLVININNLYHKYAAGSNVAESFIALSAHAFRTRTLDQRDGYSILCLPESNVDHQEADEDPNEKGREKAKLIKDRRGIDFVLWEIVNE